VQSAAQGLRSQPGRPTTVIVVPRHPSLGEPRTFAAPAGFVWHHANAFEQGERLHIDSVWYDRFESFSPQGDFRQLDLGQLPYGGLARTTLDMRSGAVERRALGGRCCEFPTLHPARVGRPYRYVYLAAADAPTGAALLQALWKVDLTTGASEAWAPGPRRFAGEPIFVARPRSAALAHLATPDVGDAQGNTAPDEDDGWLLSVVYDAARHASELVILDARDLTAGPLATLRLDHHLPHGLHGSFTAARFG
jgi:all-trans-8'-apo-beta-carotenal 15,15'-oxygenase